MLYLHSDLKNNMDREKIACSCRRITYGMIEDAVDAGAKNYEEAQKLLGFGRGCGKCVEFIEFLIADLNKTAC